MIHMIREMHYIDVCPRCRQSMKHKRFESEFHGKLHYKAARCDCGEKVWVKVNFDGSGHDNWHEEIRKNSPIQNIEEVLRKH